MPRRPREPCLGDVGEFGLIDRIAALARRVGGAAVALGIGDDAAILRLGRGEALAVTSDALVEGVHFRLDQETPRTVGRRALAANLSDLAAMGARPLGFTCALAAPPSLSLGVALGLVRGMLDLAARHGCPLVGGNVSRASEISLTLAALGAVARGKALTRAGARPGDRLLVTGSFGRSALERALGRVRHVPEPRVAAGLALARGGLARACIDVSDGLLADLSHLCRASRVGALIDARRVPLARGLEAAARRADLDPLRLALAGGEDYELLFVVGPRGPSAARLGQQLGVQVTEVGAVTARGLEVAGAPAGWSPAPGWRHF
jgi:thiamine-monophosphate kinase